MNFDAYEEIQKGSLSQFRNKPITNGIQRAIADTLQGIYEESQQLRLLGDIERMSGRNLDVIGERLGLSRSEAYIILRSSQSIEVTDEVYRKCLRWKQLKNNFTGTYPEIMESIRILWKTDNIIYSEMPEYPAHIFISMPLFDVETQDPWLGKALVLKPDGVSMTFTSDYLTQITESKIESIRAPAMHLYMKLYWSKAYTFDGTLKFDGKQTFYGWTYNLPVSMVHGAARIIINENIIARHSVSIKLLTLEEVKGENILMYLGGLLNTEECNFKIDNHARINISEDIITCHSVSMNLLTSEKVDGINTLMYLGRLLSTENCNFKIDNQARIIINEDIIGCHSISIKVPIIEKIEGANTQMYLGGLLNMEECNFKVSYYANMASGVEAILGNKVIYSHDPGFFNGQYTFNGARKFDAYYKEEDF